MKKWVIILSILLILSIALNVGLYAKNKQDTKELLGHISDYFYVYYEATINEENTCEENLYLLERAHFTDGYLFDKMAENHVTDPTQLLDVKSPEEDWYKYVEENNIEVP
jgi:hypothetical protein